MKLGIFMIQMDGRAKKTWKQKIKCLEIVTQTVPSVYEKNEILQDAGDKQWEQSRMGKHQGTREHLTDS